MMNWFQRLLPREEKFFDLFEFHAEALVAGAGELRRLLDGGPELTLHCKAMIEKETKADRIAAEVMEPVRRTFITPFDRSDIQELIQAMDDFIDQMNQTAKTAILFDVCEFDPRIREMADLAIEAAALTQRAMPLLREIAKHAAGINAYVSSPLSASESCPTTPWS